MSRRRGLVAAILCLILATGCTGRQSGRDARVVDVVARGLTFEAPDSVPSGWVTVRFHNASPVTHFALVERLPEHVSISEQQQQVAPVFQAGMDFLTEGRADSAMAAFGGLPEWYSDFVFLGGPGLTGPGETSETTLRLEPGRYLLECYVKTGGTFHSFNRDTAALGMVHEFVVTEAASPQAEPTPDMTLTLSAEGGLQVDGTPRQGSQVIAVNFADQRPHENFVGHDVHLLRVTDETNLDSVAAWMDWTRPPGLQTPAPAQFLGGVNEMPAGSVGYLTVALEPGRYAWISEVPNAKAKNMLIPFTVE